MKSAKKIIVFFLAVLIIMLLPMEVSARTSPLVYVDSVAGITYRFTAVTTLVSATKVRASLSLTSHTGSGSVPNYLFGKVSAYGMSASGSVIASKTESYEYWNVTTFTKTVVCTQTGASFAKAIGVYEFLDSPIGTVIDP